VSVLTSKTIHFTEHSSVTYELVSIKPIGYPKLIIIISVQIFLLLPKKISYSLQVNDKKRTFFKKKIILKKLFSKYCFNTEFSSVSFLFLLRKYKNVGIILMRNKKFI
jgi:hypothetical protein